MSEFFYIKIANISILSMITIHLLKNIHMTQRQQIRRFFEPAREMWRATVRSILRNILISSQSTYNALFMWLIWASLESQNIQKTTTMIMRYGIWLWIIHLCLELTSVWWWPETLYQQMKIISNKYLKAYTKIDWNYLDNLWTWKTIAILTQWFEKRSQLCVDTIWYATWFIISFISGIYFALNISWQFAVWYIIVFYAILNISYLFDKPAIQRRNKRRDSVNEYTRQLTRFIMSRFEIIQNNKISYEVNRAWVHIWRSWEYTMNQASYLNRMLNVPKTIISIFRIIIYTLWATMYFKSSISLSSLTSILWYMMIIDELMIKYIQWYKNTTKDINYVTKLWSIFDNAPKHDWYKIWTKYVHNNGSINFENVSYSYSLNKFILRNFNLKIGWWQKVALVWPSWWWKSTLIKLIAWYIRPNEWNITVDQQTLPWWDTSEHVSLKSYYKHIGYLTQEPSIFDGTIKENLLYWIPVTQEANYSEELPQTIEPEYLWKQIKEVIQLSRCEWIYDLPEWLETQVWEKWVRLSWGQRQRLAIAKIMMKNPDIILLDEPTSALDSENEELVTQALDNLFKNKTVIVVAHRLQTVKQSDLIIYIDRPSNTKFEKINEENEEMSDDFSYVAEQWTHEELIQIKWKYHKMVELQSWF